jgi:hypothetical protein
MARRHGRHGRHGGCSGLGAALDGKSLGFLVWVIPAGVAVWYFAIRKAPVTAIPAAAATGAAAGATTGASVVTDAINAGAALTNQLINAAK